jgi:hypothetical protein
MYTEYLNDYSCCRNQGLTTIKKIFVEDHIIVEKIMYIKMMVAGHRIIIIFEISICLNLRILFASL